MDCDYVMVENIDSNPAQTVSMHSGNETTDINRCQGQFTAKTTVPLLTVYRVGCIPVTSAVSRRDYREYGMPEIISPQTALPDSPQHEPQDLEKRTSFEGHALNQVLSIAERLSSAIDPNNENITVREFRLLEETNTALFALNIVNSGLPLDEMCEYLRDAGIANHLDEDLIDAQQAANIICFASIYGLYFNMTNNELLSDLAALEYAIQLHSYGSQTLQDLCKTLDYSAASFLGIDTAEIQNTICNGTEGVTHSTASTIASVTAPSTTGNSPPTATPSYPTSVFTSASGTAASSGAHSSSIIFGSDGPAFSSATSAAGTVGPWFNTTSIPVTATTETADVLTVTASAGDASAETSTGEPNMFYSPPRLRRAGLRRHDRAIF